MNNVNESKKNLRKIIKNRIEELNKEYIDLSSFSILQKIISLPEYQKTDSIFCFVGTEKEINTRLIIEKALKDGKKVAVPKCVELGIMEAYEIKSLDDLVVGKYDIYEPKEYCKVMVVNDIDLGIIPCLSCNSEGERLGYGAGFYDRYLKDTNFPRVVICMEKVMYKKIPLDEHDLKMDIVVNENQIYRLKNKRE